MVRTSEYNHHNNMISLEELCMNPTAIKSILPGLILCGILAFSAQALSNLPVLKGHFPVGAVMLAILLGTATRQFIPIGTSMEPGIRFAFKRVLRLGVAGLGFSLTFNDIEAVGFRGLLLDTALITGTYFFALALRRWMDLGKDLPWLIATGTAICGASAVVAANSVLKAKDEEVAFSVATVTLFGTFSMFLFPLIAHLGGIPVPIYGAWAGSSIHEVAQVIGATMNISPKALDFATILKLTRVAFLLPVLIFLEILLIKEGQKLVSNKTSRAEHFPWFVVGFAALVIVNSVHLISPALTVQLQHLDTWLLALSMAALGLETHLGRVLSVGRSAMLAGFWLWIFVSLWGLALSVVLFGHSFHGI
ncbi:YeiH family protein [Leptospirillum ferriphilum]|uniref:Uncharacterized protein n=3 Tax=Leptospirillum ferriphilum TaxID=178606 RepID=A0A059Y1G6_9BACT|nr:YeiH family protein [Leptospirillum ferriphilum]AFS54626.1 putative membrane protein [Leptospirillum ferriphilum ML-04]AIA31287.1 hypothetical protein Y981_12680 [Leptospirillum ferriphilum YSK]